MEFRLPVYLFVSSPREITEIEADRPVIRETIKAKRNEKRFDIAYGYTYAQDER